MLSTNFKDVAMFNLSNINSTRYLVLGVDPPAPYFSITCGVKGNPALLLILNI